MCLNRTLIYYVCLNVTAIVTEIKNEQISILMEMVLSFQLLNLIICIDFVIIYICML